jgi:hypothetical protein
VLQGDEVFVSGQMEIDADLFALSPAIEHRSLAFSSSSCFNLGAWSTCRP